MTFTTQSCEYDTAFGPDSPLYRSTCRGCTLRTFAAGPLYHSSSRLGMLTPAYVRAIRAAFEGADPVAVHAEVKAVAERKFNQRAEVL